MVTDMVMATVMAMVMEKNNAL